MDYIIVLVVFGFSLLCTVTGYLIGYKIAAEEAKRHINRVLNQVEQNYGQWGDE